MRDTRRTQPLLVSALLVVACSGTTPAGARDGTGSVALPLQAVSTGGKVYQLRSAVFDIAGPTTTTLITDDTTNASAVLSATLLVGSYSITLRPGWSLTRIAAGSLPQPVAATVTSGNPVAFSIAGGASTMVGFAFMVSGETVDFTTGTLNVGISVTDDGGAGGSGGAGGGGGAPVGVTPSLAAAGAGVDGTGDLLVPYPPGVVAGQFLILQIGSRDANVPAAPAGWLGIATGQGGNARQYLYGKRALGTESGTLAVATGASNVNAARMYAFNDVTTTGFLIEIPRVSTDADGTLPGPTVATIGKRRLAVALIAIDSNPPMGPFVGETGGDWTEPVPELSTGTGLNFGLQLQLAPMTEGGTIMGGEANFGGASDASVCISFALSGSLVD